MRSLVLISGVALFATACGNMDMDPNDPASLEAEGSTSAELKKSLISCNKDTDCVAVDENACCGSGRKVAIKKGKVADYKKLKKSLHCLQHQICPLFLIWDRRSAECNANTKTCEMVKTDDIQCGGFVTHPHQCPTGYECRHVDAKGHLTNPDLPGRCVEKKLTDQCGGCASGQYCTFCWGSFACIPKGAVC